MIMIMMMIMMMKMKMIIIIPTHSNKILCRAVRRFLCYIPGHSGAVLASLLLMAGDPVRK